MGQLDVTAQQAVMLRQQGYNVLEEGGRFFVPYSKEETAITLQKLLSAGGADPAVQADQPKPGVGLQRGPKPNTTTETRVTYAKADIDNFDPRVTKALVEQGVLIQEGENFSLAEGKNLQEAINAEYKKLPTLMKIPADLQAKIPEGKAVAVQGQEDVFEINNADVEEVQRALGLTNEDGSLAEGVTKSEPQEEPGGNFAISKTTTSTTTVHNEEIPIPDGVMLKDDKNARKGLQKQYEAKLEEWVKDPQNKALMDYSIAQMKYGKKVDKEAENLAKKSDFDLYNEYADMFRFNPDVINEIDNAADAFLNDPEKVNAIMHDYNKTQKNPSHRYDNVEEFKQTSVAWGYARMYAFEEAGIHRDDILNAVAVNNVLKKRDADKIESDQKWFIENMAKREVEMRRDKQIFENTVPHFSKDDKNAAKKDGTQDPNKIHTDIGKSGRKLVEKSLDINPEMFCSEMKDGVGSLTAKQMEERGIFQRDGKYYQFDGNKWQQFFLRGSDSRKDEGKFEKDFTEDFHTTLTEARTEWLTNQENLSGKTLDDLIGNANGKVGNRELNRYNGMAKTAGIQHDTNKTVLKRFGHIGKGALIGGAAGAASFLLPWYMAAGVGLAGTTADQLISYHGRTEDQIINGVAKGQVTTTDYYTDKYGTTSVTHITDVDVPYQDVAPGQDYSGQVKAKGQHWKGDPNRATTNAAALGALVGGLKNALTANHVEAKGSRWDHVIDLSSDKVLKPEVAQENEGIQTPPRYVTSFDVTKTEEKDVEKLPAVRWRAPEAYAGLYMYEDGTPVKAQDFQKAYREAAHVDTMTKRYFYVYPELMINGKKVILRDDYEAQYGKITIGTNDPKVVDKDGNGKTSSTYNTQVTKKSYKAG